MLRLHTYGEADVLASFAEACARGKWVSVVAESPPGADLQSDSSVAPADAVCFLTPFPEIAHLAEAAAAAGMHVYVPGLPTEDPAELERLLAACRRAGVILACASSLLARPWHASTARLCVDQTAGLLAYYRYVWLEGGAEDLRWRTAEAVTLSNAVLGQAPHTVFALDVASPAGPTTHLSITLSYPGGATALLAVGTCPVGDGVIEASFLQGDLGVSCYDASNTEDELEAHSGTWQRAPARGDRLAWWVESLAKRLEHGDAMDVETDRARTTARVMAAVDRATRSGGPCRPEVRW